MANQTNNKSSELIERSRGQWKEVARLTFKGEPYADHALDLIALRKLAQFQKLVSETAKELWRRANPDRDRLPAHFEARTRLCLRRIEEGSAVAPLEVYLDPGPQLEFLAQEPEEVTEAVGLIHDVFQALEEDRPLPEKLPRSLLPEFEDIGKGLEDAGELTITSPKQEKPVRIDRTITSRIGKFADTPYDAPLDLIGEMLAADIKAGRFQIWTDESTHITVQFTPEQEDAVTTALRDHKKLRIHVTGRGLNAPDGRLLRASTVESWQVVPAVEFSFDDSARPIEDVIAELVAEIPSSEWSKIPKDLTDNLDHYLYGTPKK